MVMTPDFQSGDDGFDPRMLYVKEYKFVSKQGKLYIGINTRLFVFHIAIGRFSVFVHHKNLKEVTHLGRKSL